MIKTAFRQLARLHSLPYWLFLGLFIVSAVICVTALRHNNQTMIRLRGDVYVADKDNSNVESSLDALRAYVYSHMNTDLSTGSGSIKPPIQLRYTYERLQAAAEAAGNNSGLYTEAENYCQGQVPAGTFVSLRGTIVPCVQNYVASRGGNAPVTIAPALYEFDFVSPSWSPDLAGWSLVASIIFFLAFVVSFLTDRLKRREI